MWQAVSRVTDGFHFMFANPVSRRVARPFVAMLYASITSSVEGCSFDVDRHEIVVDTEEDEVEAGVGVGVLKCMPAFLGLSALLYVVAFLPNGLLAGGVEALVVAVTALFVGAVGIGGTEVEYRAVEAREEL